MESCECADPLAHNTAHSTAGHLEKGFALEFCHAWLDVAHDVDMRLVADVVGKAQDFDLLVRLYDACFAQHRMQLLSVHLEGLHAGEGGCGSGGGATVRVETTKRKNRVHFLKRPCIRQIQVKTTGDTQSNRQENGSMRGKGEIKSPWPSAPWPPLLPSRRLLPPSARRTA